MWRSWPVAIRESICFACARNWVLNKGHGIRAHSHLFDSTSKIHLYETPNSVIYWAYLSPKSQFKPCVGESWHCYSPYQGRRWWARLQIFFRSLKRDWDCVSMRRSALHHVLTVLNSRVMNYWTTYFVDAQKVVHLSVQYVIHQSAFLGNCTDSIASVQVKSFPRTLKLPRWFIAFYVAACFLVRVSWTLRQTARRLIFTHISCDIFLVKSGLYSVQKSTVEFILIQGNCSEQKEP